MARTTQAEEITALIERLEASRREVGSQTLALREKLDVPKRLKQSMLQKPWWWFGGSVSAGLLASAALKRRPKKHQKKWGGWPKWILGLIFTLLKPSLKSLATREIQKRLTQAVESSNKRATRPESPTF